MPKRLGLSDVSAMFTSKQCTLVSKQYVSNKKLLEFLCSCGNPEICVVTLQYFRLHGTNCTKCRTDRMIVTNNERHGVDFISQRLDLKQQVLSGITAYVQDKKHVYTDVKADFSRANLKLLSTVYVDLKSQLLYRCMICSNESSMTYGKLLHRGQGCGSLECTTAKRKQTCLDKFGVICSLLEESIAQKSKETMLRLYGVEHASQSDALKQKAIQTNLAKYGTMFTFQSEVVKKRIRQSILDKYGVEYSSQRFEVKQKTRQTNVERFGVPFCMQSHVIQQKSRETCMQRYGVDYPMQNPVISERSQIRAFSSKLYRMPSGLEVVVQGWENYAMDILLQTYTEQEIVLGRISMPEIWYTDGDGKYRRYFCDMFIPKENLIVEVKSTYTYQLGFNQTNSKRKACSYAGYNFKLMLFDSKKQLIS